MTTKTDSLNPDYIEDKADQQLIALARVIDILNSSELPHEVREELLDQVCLATTMGTRILAAATGADCYLAHRDLIMDQGLRGYRDLAEQWQVSSRVLEMDVRTPQEVLDDFASEVRPLLEGPRSPNRTQIHELLVRTPAIHPAVRRIADLTEQVTNGEVTWEAYIKQVKELL